MNPNTTIRPWLLACGAQYGIEQAHDYRWADADTRQEEQYFTYRLMSSRQLHDGIFDLTEAPASGHDVVMVHVQKWLTTVRIELHNSQNGLFELAACVVAAEGNAAIRAIFDDQCSLHQVLSLENLSEATDEEVTYLQRLEMDFEEDIVFELTDTNALVDTLELTLNSTFSTKTITR